MCFELPSGFVGWASLGCKTAPSFGKSLKIAVFERCYGAREAMGGRDKGEDALSPSPFMSWPCDFSLPNFGLLAKGGAVLQCRVSLSVECFNRCLQNRSTLSTKKRMI